MVALCGKQEGRIERYVRKKGCVLLLFTIDGLQTTEFENKQGASGSNDGMEGEHRANLQLHHPIAALVAQSGL